MSEDYGVISDAPLIKNQFKELILSLYHKTGGIPVVVLIDEYDKPLIDHLGKGEKGFVKKGMLSLSYSLLVTCYLLFVTYGVYHDKKFL
ncbi:MAG: AAA family ATPase [Desulfobacterales bacterium]|nr:AAA family ATPase [Desulfobacterales bacterium]